MSLTLSSISFFHTSNTKHFLPLFELTADEDIFSNGDTDICCEWGVAWTVSMSILIFVYICFFVVVILAYRRIQKRAEMGVSGVVRHNFHTKKLFHLVFWYMMMMMMNRQNNWLFLSTINFFLFNFLFFSQLPSY
jgi:hypothetical protein